jgi:hypothetical protein
MNYPQKRRQCAQPPAGRGQGAKQIVNAKMERKHKTGWGDCEVAYG